MAKGDDVLIIQIPHRTCRAHRREEMNVRSREPRRMRTAEFVAGYALGVTRGQVLAFFMADKNGAIRESGQRVQAHGELIGVLRDDDRRVCGQRVRVHSGHKNRMRHALRRRHTREGSRPQRRPAAGTDQLRDHGLSFKAGHLLGGVCGKRAFVAFFDVDHD